MMRDSRAFSVCACITLIAFLWSSVLGPAMAYAQTSSDQPAAKSEVVEACDQAEHDAKAEHRSTGYGIGGFFCGVFGLIFATASNPQVPADKLLGKSPDYVSTYTRCYKQEAKSKNVRTSLIGWGIGAAVAIVILVVSSSSSSSD